MIKKTSELVLVEVGANAHFECLVDANPVNEQVITWKRRKNDSESSVPSSSSSSSSYDKSDDSEESSSSSVFNRMRTDVEVFNSEENGASPSSFGGVPLKGTLMVLNASLADSGTSFDCLADNGVGKRSKATMTLLVLRKFICCFLLLSHSFAMVLSYANGLLAATWSLLSLSHVFTVQSFVRGNLLFGCCLAAAVAKFASAMAADFVGQFVTLCCLLNWCPCCIFFFSFDETLSSFSTKQHCIEL